MIRPDQLQRLCPRLGPVTAALLAPMFDAEGTRCDITTDARIAAWLARISVETAGLTEFAENLNYGAPGLTATWPSHFPANLADAYARQPEKIANRAYAGRYGNGDEASGDGWRYRGRGCLQLTFKDNYAAASGWTGLDLVGDPDQLGVAGLPAVRTAADFWRVNDLNALADASDIVGIVRKIDGGLNGLTATRAAYATARGQLWPG